MKVWTLLFDIDGTLMTSDHAGTNAMATTARELFNIQQIGPLEVHGRCDRGILGDLFDRLDLSYDEHHEAFCQRYYQNLPASLIANNGRLLPGVKNLLEQLKAREDVALGLLTGNLQQAAQIKLSHVGITDFFSFGGFGDHFADRNDVAASAVTAAQAELGDRFDPNKMLVIGDTVNDVRCGRSIGAKVVAVETGGGSREQLQGAAPDLLLADLSQTPQIANLLKLA
jgi:phosphoglycolate phosphatase-like HAD superfamily hydrolase